MANKTISKEISLQWFTQQLMSWNKVKNKRKMPWKGEKDPYKIWLSEVILQQTRVEQGLDYYNKFIQYFPTIIALAEAKEEQVFKLWEGLGYYSRCRNLLHTARFIVFELEGKFPTEYEAILKLKGVGPYTAAAISSFAFNLPYAVVDGNVFRVIARYLGIDTPIDTLEGKKQFTALAQQLLDHNQPGRYNQAIMDFGATVCKPALPNCSNCMLATHCHAFLNTQVNQYPIKTKIINRKKRWIYYMVFHYKDAIGIRQRQQKDIWQGLHEFYSVESTTSIQWNEETILQWLQEQLNLKTASVLYISSISKQQLTHQQISSQFIHIKIKQLPMHLGGLIWIKESDIREFAFPRIITAYLESLHIKKPKMVIK
ncbi:A/G-specific adenine glycosylase [Sediminibacterium sp.]|uniref:A/G-specific adenine glycosylase n=1 Tax=Sediminibacterium sp. TaxID=1917865 RepID=UPI003F6E45F4